MYTQVEESIEFFVESAMLQKIIVTSVSFSICLLYTGELSVTIVRKIKASKCFERFSVSIFLSCTSSAEESNGLKNRHPYFNN